MPSTSFAKESQKFKDKLPNCKIENKKVIIQAPCYGAINYSDKEYTGNFNNGLRNGMGTQYYWNSHKRYAGEWKNDKMHGQALTPMPLADKLEKNIFLVLNNC